MLNWKNWILAGAMLVMVGCGYKGPLSRIKNQPPDPVNETPLAIDGAMQLRDWNRSTAFYANGDTPAGPLGFPYEIRKGRAEWIYAIEEPVLFTGQSVLLPIFMIVSPPWADRMYTGATITPTYTAMPVLPPSPPPEKQ